MKKILITFVLFAASLSAAYSQFTKIGGGISYGTGFHYNKESGAFAVLYRSPFAGIFLNGIYEFNLPLHIAPSFTYFFPRTNSYAYAVGNITERTRVSSMMFDINGHYVINSLDRFEFYGLAGIDITFAHIKWIGSDSKESDNVFGLNLGAGTYIKLTNQFDLSCEAKYLISKYSQFMINVGVLVNIDWLSKHENTGL
jgi:opacity protein-like surface antigen